MDRNECSSGDANVRVKAARCFDMTADGLSPGLAWEGNVFLNPPFSTREGKSLQGLFFERCVNEYKAGNVKQAIVLLKSGTGYNWFKPVLAWPHCFLDQRLAFVRPVTAPDGSLSFSEGLQNPHGSVLIYLGPQVDKFVNLFSALGMIPGKNAWGYVPSVS